MADGYTLHRDIAAFSQKGVHYSNMNAAPIYSLRNNYENVFPLTIWIRYPKWKKGIIFYCILPVGN